MPPHFLLTLTVVTALAGAANGQFISGTVVDAEGLPLASVSISAKDSASGNIVAVINGTTDQSGNFLALLPVAGIYDLAFMPPSGLQLLPLEVDGVIVAATMVMGTLQLQAGVAVSGTVVDSLGLPAAGIDLDVIDQLTGHKLLTPGDTTNVFGAYSVVVPTTPIDLQFDTRNHFPVLAPKSLELTLSGDTDLGATLLDPGFILSGSVSGPAGPVQGADTDVIDTVTKDKLFTPGDNTDVAGNFSVTVPAGTYIVEVCPSFATQLLGQEFPGAVVAANTNLGSIVLAIGEALTGVVTDSAGLPIQGVDVDLDDALGVGVLLCNDNTNDAGQYAVVVPAGVWTVTFESSYSKPYGSSIQTGVSIAGATTLDASLPDCPFHTTYGAGHPGSGGLVPLLETAGGAPRLGNSDFGLLISNGLGGTTAFLILGFAPAAYPFKGGTLLIELGSQHFFFGLPLSGVPGVSGTGTVTLPTAVPMDPFFAGVSWFGQAVVQDNGASSLYSLSNGVQITSCE